MPFDPNWPIGPVLITDTKMLEQFTGLKALIDAVPAGPAGAGFNLRGEYAVGVTYQTLDVVTWNNLVYLATTTTSQPPDVFPDWRILSIVGPQGLQGLPGADGQQGPPGQGLVMQGDWLDYQTYNPGDVVAYNSQTYVTMTGAVGTPPDQAGNWRLLSITGPAGAPGEVTMGQLNAAIQAQASRNCDAVQFFDASGLSPEGQTIVGYLNTLLASLHSPV